jgi:D-alanyl-lipoteichoic acid acyltransferase DltB (MBOAT superfamily)
MDRLIEDVKALGAYSLQKPWFFTEYSFLLLLAVFLIGYSFFPRVSKLKNAYLILFSLFFYYKSSGPFLVLFVGVIGCDFYLARWMDKLNGNKKKLFLFFTIVYSLSFLLYFKYSNFILTNLNGLFGTDFSPKSLFLPIGISFYTFQSLSYLIDVYRKEIAPSKNLIDYAFYMTFFPHLVAGPIVRAKDFLPQIKHPIAMNYDLLKEGLLRLTVGLLKKLLIADYLAKYVDLIHDAPAGFSGFEHYASMYAYSFQIYFDFSGYSDIAIGIALLLGYRLNENFDNPYSASNITVFWRKWHISLSQWLRDYIYIPLGGNRRGLINTYLFLLITMFIGGLWHGADWKFVFWGIGHGFLLVIHKLVFKNETKNSYLRIAGIILTFHLVSILWIFFRASSFDTAFLSIQKLLFTINANEFFGFWMTRPEIIILLVISSAIVFFPTKWKQTIFSRLNKIPLVLWPFILLLALQLILQFKDNDVQPFIYFQF